VAGRSLATGRSLLRLTTMQLSGLRESSNIEDDRWMVNCSLLTCPSHATVGILLNDVQLSTEETSIVVQSTMVLGQSCSIVLPILVSVLGLRKIVDALALRKRLKSV